MFVAPLAALALSDQTKLLRCWSRVGSYCLALVARRLFLSFSFFQGYSKMITAFLQSCLLTNDEIENNELRLEDELPYRLLPSLVVFLFPMVAEHCLWFRRERFVPFYGFG